MKTFSNSLMILIVGFAVTRTISGVLVNHVIEYFGLVGAEQGYMNSVISIGTTAAVISTIVLRWKVKKTTILVISGILTVAMMVMTGLSVSFFMLLAVSLIYGLSLGWTDTYTNSCVVDIDREGSAKRMSTMQGFYAVGAIIAPLAIAALLTANSWQGVYIIIAPFYLLTIVILIFSLRAAAGQDLIKSMESPKFTAKEIKLFLLEKRSALLIAANMTYYTMQYGLFAWLVRYMNVEYGAEVLGMMSITVMWVCTAISRFLVPRLPFDNMKVHSYGSLIAGATLFIGIFSGNPWIMCIVIGIGALTTGNSLPTLINRRIVTYQGNTLLPSSTMFLSMQVTGMIVPPVLGAIAVYSMQGSMVLLAVAILISGCFGFAVLRYRENKIVDDIV